MLVLRRVTLPLSNKPVPVYTPECGARNWRSIPQILNRNTTQRPRSGLEMWLMILVSGQGTLLASRRLITLLIPYAMDTGASQIHHLHKWACTWRKTKSLCKTNTFSLPVKAVLINSSHVFVETFQLPVSSSMSFLFITIGFLHQNLKACTHSTQVCISHGSNRDHIKQWLRNQFHHILRNNCS